MDVKVLGTGCAKCRKLYAEAEKAIAQSGVPATLTKVESIDDIMAYDVLLTPALVIDGQVRSSGRIPRTDELVSWLTTAAAKS